MQPAYDIFSNLTPQVDRNPNQLQDGRQLLPNRVMSELPVARPQISGREPLAAPLPRPGS